MGRASPLGAKSRAASATLSLGSAPLNRGDAPSPSSLRSLDPPPHAGRVNNPPRSRDAPSHPSFASRFKKALRASLKRREAERRQAHHGFRPAADRKPASVCGARLSPPPANGAGSKERRARLSAPHRGIAEVLPLDSAPGRASWNHRIQTGGPSPAPVQRAPRSPVTRRTVDAQNRPGRAVYRRASREPLPLRLRSTLAKASFVADGILDSEGM